MSVEARRWAHEQQCGTSSRQFVLHLLAEWADPWGYVRHVNVDYIAAKTVQSRANVFRHFEVFEQHGLLKRYASRNEGGALTYSGQLDLARSLQLPKQTKRRNGEAETGDSAPFLSGPESQDATHSFEMGVATCDSEESQHATPSLYLESESKESLSSPSPQTVTDEGLGEEDEATGAEPTEDDPRQAAETEPDESFDEALEAAFAILISAYPVHAAMDLQGARRELAKIPRWEWAEVNQAAERLAAAGKKHRRLHPKDLATWLRQRGDRLINQIAGPDDSPTRNGRKVFVIEGTRAWDAHLRARRAAGKLPPPRYVYRDEDGSKPHLRGKSGWFFDSLFPPGESGPLDF